MSEEAIATTMFWILLAFGVVLALGMLAALSFGVGLIVMNAAGADLGDANDQGFWRVCFAGVLTIGAVLLLVFLLVGFIRFSWYAWA